MLAVPVKNMKRIWDGNVDDFLGQTPIAPGDLVRKRCCRRDSGKTFVFGTLERGEEADTWCVNWEGEGLETFGAHRAESLRIKGKCDAPTRAFIKRIRPTREPLKEENASLPPPPPPTEPEPEPEPVEDAQLPPPPTEPEPTEDAPSPTEPTTEPTEPTEPTTETTEPEQSFVSTKAARYYAALQSVGTSKPSKDAPTVGKLAPPGTPPQEVNLESAALPEEILRIENWRSARKKLRSAVDADNESK